MTQDLEATLPVRLRHIKLGSAADPGARQAAGTWLTPDPEGLNGREGFQGGTIERRVSDEGQGSLTFPNANGKDGRRHLDRFAIIADGDDYRLGDEWIEVWEGDVGAGDLLATLTPTGGPRDRQTVGLDLSDALVLLRQTRESSACAWAHAPRDILTYYSRIKQFEIADAFDGDDVWTRGIVESVSASGWSYLRAAKAAGGGQVKLSGSGANNLAYVRAPVTAPGEFGAARIEAVIETPALATDDVVSVKLGTASTDVYTLQAVNGRLIAYGQAFETQVIVQQVAAGMHRVAIEVRERWLWFYWDGRLVATLPRSNVLPATSSPTYNRAEISLVTSVNAALVVHSVTYRRLVRYLQQTNADRGPLRLPDGLTAEGLDGRWYSDVDRDTARTLEPIAAPVGTRLEPQINFPAANPPAWRHPSVPASTPWSAQWTGAIYLVDPANTQIRVTVTGRVRIWIGATRWTEQLIDVWGSSPASAQITSVAVGAQDGEAGWYPIRIEYQTNGAAAAGLIVETNVSAAGWKAIGDTANAGAPLSPLGCFVGDMRRLSHFEAISDIARDFAIQYTVEPRSLESGEFPGYLRTGRTIGRITDRVITDDEATAVQVQTQAEGTVDILTADAAGLADPTSAAQLSAEIVNYAGVQPGRHLAVQEEQEQLSDVTTESSMLQRLDALLTLRSSVWEQVDARPGRRRDMVDSFPLTGQLAELSWEPGDAARLSLDSVGLIDTTPRQAMGVSRDIRPDGVGLPTLKWRQRPRGVREFVRQLQRQALDPQRTYQGQLTTITGSVAIWNLYGAANADAVWASRVNWARDTDALVKAELVVTEVTGSWDINVNGTIVGKTVTVAGRYDITPWVAATAATVVKAFLAGGTGGYVVQLELTVRI